MPVDPRAYKDFTPRIGVYTVRLGELVLTGWSPHLDASTNRLRFELDAGTYLNAAIQRAWKNDPATLEISVLDELAPDPGHSLTHDYSSDLTELEALHRQRLGLPPRPAHARGLR